ncbi:3-hydroxyacyl-CoA dehydrogenase/enoyl-CoA hydratase/carnithine racemase [Naumannella cuiyingiana]|uniref:3-hydroxyacyl-CoA dehydrogenase/enoyl-CoA hydratase/carnithine racemase n=1 Tax=Naumannella cuiyingiana TaxID=1347891 RepID=A0A7Z0IMG5_9ACTN|nr:3-hydroxyacyl-CoA dehydrogenase/enoyl-CoA hydratase/carnithine racemase [Naumannella cuiyingiana]
MSESTVTDEILSGPALDDALALAAEQTTDEVVTHALSRDVALPGGAGTLVLITLDNGLDHNRPNTFGPAGLTELNAAIDAAAARTDIVGIAVTGKPFILAAGADLSQVGKITDREQAKLVARIGHGVFDKLHAVEVPTFCLINGLALGGGLEIALHCDYRTINAAAPALGLPECFLGLLPGWGGLWLLPHLIGAPGATKVIIENALSQNRMLKAPQAHQLGIADAMFEGADFLERSLDWVARVITGEVTVQRRAVDTGQEWSDAVAKAREFADSKVGGVAPAPYRALDILAANATRDRAAGFAAEDDGLADLIMGDELRAGLYAFDLVQKRAKRPAGAPDKALARKITKVGIVGAGLMASQLAMLFARRLGVPVVMSDLDQQRVDKGIGYVHGEIDKLHAKGRLNPDKVNRYKALISGTTDTGDFADCDFVIEAVFEELGLKQQIFADLEKIVSAECVLATNTSSLSITEMASGLGHPERVVGFHFFNPVAILPLLEIIRGRDTDDATLATAFAVAKQLKKNAVLVADAPAFVVNRVLTRMLSEITATLDEGTDFEVADRALAPLGLPMSPFVLLQLVGPAVALHVNETLNAAFGDRFPVSQNLRRLVEAKRSGIYDYDDQGRPFVSDETRALFTVGDQPSTEEQVRTRVEDALADEIRRMLDEEVVADARDIDLCLILGAGYPFHLGGITPYLDRSGAAERATGRRFAEPGVASLA